MAKKVLTVVGARPQFVKAAVVSRALRAHGGLHEVLVHTGQHYDDNMSEVFFREMAIPKPDHCLQIGSGSHGAMTGRMLEALEAVMMSEKPDWVLVYGDTNSTLAGALAAVKLHIPVAHVEAGLRSFNRKMPEEINRIAADHVCDLLFAPTEVAVGHLTREGIPASQIVVSGDVMYDATLFYAAQAKASGILGELGLESGGYILATVHRAESTDSPERLDAILGGLREAAKDLPVVLPLHPRTRARADADAFANLTVIDPVGYFDMLALEGGAKLVVTDSGGVQKEAFFQSVPCLTLRSETEWVELVDLGWNRLADLTNSATVAASIAHAMREPKGADAKPYGHGDAGQKIVEALGAA